MFVVASIFVTVLAYITWDVRTERDMQRRVQWVKENVPRSAVLFRGEEVCQDGCGVGSLDEPRYTLKLSEYGVLKIDGPSCRPVRALNLPRCPTEGLHRFGLSDKGQVYVTWTWSALWGTLRGEDRCIVDYGPYAAVYLKDGRLHYY